VQNKSPESWTTKSNYPLITYTDGSRIIQKSISAEDRSLKVNIDFISDEQLLINWTNFLRKAAAQALLSIQ
jgi:hypothetical protein